MQYNPIAFASVEQNLLWSALTLQNANYSSQEMRAGDDPLAPYFVSVAPLASGANEGKLFARISANIELDPSLAYGDGPLALAAKADNSADSVPSGLYQGLTLAGSGSASGDISLSLPFSDAAISLYSENIPQDDFWVLGVPDAVDASLTFDKGNQYGLIRTMIGGVTGLSMEFFHQANPMLSLSSNTVAADSWTVFCLAALESPSDSYFHWLAGPNAYLGFVGNAIEIPGVSSAVPLPSDLDRNLHLYTVVFDSTECLTYLDGVLLKADTRSALTVAWNGLITNENGNFIVTDIVAVPRKLTFTELNTAHASFAASRSITVATI